MSIDIISRSSNHTSECGTLSAPHSEHDAFVGILLMLATLTIALNLAHFLKHKNFTYLGESAVYILLGLLVSAGWTSLSYDPHNTAIQLNSEFFSLVLLPPIIFEGGFNLQRKSFFNNIIPILSLALLGAFYSTFVTSVIMWGFSQLIYETGWTMIEALVFGSIISSTDPVTVLSLLPSSVDRRLYMLIFGESALNDAVAIILYRFFTGLQAEASDLGVFPFLVSVIASFGVFLGSFCVGIFCALVFAKITKHVWIEGYEGAIYEMVMLFVFAYSSYLLAEVLSLTGIISIFFCGIAMSHYAYSNLTDLTKRSMKVAIRMLCLMCEGFIFLYLGLGLLSFNIVYDPVFIFCAILAILVSRTHVFIICSLARFFPGQPPIPINQQTLIWFSGLRGAVAFALGVTFLDHPDFGSAIKGLIFGTTVIVVVTTVLVFGGLTPYMLRWLKIVDGEGNSGTDGHGEHRALPTAEAGAAGAASGAAAAAHGGHGGAGGHGGGGGGGHGGGGGGGHGGQEIGPGAEDAENVITEEDLEQPVFGFLYRFDAKYIRPHFSHQAKDHIQALEVIQRRESRRESVRASRTASVMDGLPRHSLHSLAGSFPHTHMAAGGIVASPLATATKKNDVIDEYDDKAKLINKTNTVDEIPLEAVNLN
ncbi:hypothetical protein HK105_207207 [Polyrhizophydium stewartii]|uniref:Sodium/hydrogen exchanger n=1 Tax=Polyrhizophydium stewartii TaxID=2732419 RepID=A0ABR4N1D7_9FUNG|nr:hypothetical protein HK105_006211 [Polyrhizophydium stewartii]